MKPLKIAFALFILAGLTLAEDKVPSRVVRVVGTAEVKVAPDQAVLELGVEKQSASARMAKKSADAAARSILASLHANGVDENDIQTTFLSLQPQFNYKKGMRIAYFTAEQTITVTVRDITKLDTLLESLIKAGGNRIDSIQYETSDLRKYRDQARDLAVKAAREKAEALAKALGQEIGKAYSIEEVPESNNEYAWGYASNVSRETMGLRPSGPTTAAGQKTVSASVTVSFDLLN